MIIELTMPCCRVDKLLDYIKAKSAHGYDVFIKTLRNHPAVVVGGDKAVERTTHEMALLIVGLPSRLRSSTTYVRRGASTVTDPRGATQRGLKC